MTGRESAHMADPAYLRNVANYFRNFLLIFGSCVDAASRFHLEAVDGEVL